MVELVDALDSKSSELLARGGSIPPSGTSKIKLLSKTALVLFPDIIMATPSGIPARTMFLTAVRQKS